MSIRIEMAMIAFDEESSIEMTIKSLFQQTLFQTNSLDIGEIGVYVLANGCTDKTSEVAVRAIEKWKPQHTSCKFHAQVVEFERADKGDTWNHFVHEISASSSNYLFMLDADIEINNASTCELVVRNLEENSDALLSGAVGLKDLSLKEKKNFIDRISLSLTQLEHDVRQTSLAGALLCGRTSFFRRIWLPKNMLNIDGFFSNLAKTDFFTNSKPDHEKVLNPEGATFVFEAYTNLGLLYNNHCRRFIGHAIRNHLNQNLITHGSENGDVSKFLKQQYDKDSNWLQNEIVQLSKEKGSSLVPWGSIWLRLKQYKENKNNRDRVRLPIILLATIWQCAVLFGVHYYLRKGDLGLVWKNSRNVRLVNSNSSVKV